MAAGDWRRATPLPALQRPEIAEAKIVPLDIAAGIEAENLVLDLDGGEIAVLAGEVDRYGPPSLRRAEGQFTLAAQAGRLLDVDGAQFLALDADAKAGAQALGGARRADLPGNEAAILLVEAVLLEA